MTDELITDLAKVSALRVISRTSVMRYKGTKKGLPEIARELNVDGIVEGSVMRRVTACELRPNCSRHPLISTFGQSRMSVIWATSSGYKVRWRSDSAASPGTVNSQQQARFRSAGSVNPDAYEAYLRAVITCRTSSRWRSR